MVLPSGEGHRLIVMWRGFNLITIFLLPLYSGSEVWEAIWNQTDLVVLVLNFCLERLHNVSLSNDKVRSNHGCQ